MHRFLIDDDGSNRFADLSADWRADLVEAVRECPPNVTTYLVCANSATCYWPTQVGVVNDRCPVLVEAIQRGEDPLRFWLEQLKASGRETFITCRMNDVHNPTEQWNIPRLRREHPACIVGHDEVQRGQAQWMSYCLDYGQAQVRQYMLALLAELLERYGDVIDGLQLDWLRFPRHLAGSPEQVWAQREVLTDFTAAVRQLLAQQARPILLGARVPTSPTGCRVMGVDLAQWGARKLVDLLVVCPFLTTDWQMPIAELRAVLHNRDIPVYAGFDLAFGPQVHFPESLRGICTSLYDCQPDGLYLFNFPCWIERLAARPYHWLQGLERPDTAAAKPLTLSVNHQRSRVPGVDQPAVIPVPLAPSQRVTLALHIPSAALPCWRALAHADCGGDVTLQVNGQPATPQTFRPDHTGPYRSEVFSEFVNHYRPKTLRSNPPDCRQFRIEPDSLQPGPNQFVFTNPSLEQRQLSRLTLNLW